jgi:hypothetical protein
LQAAALIEQGQKALAAKDFPAAYAAFVAAYRQSPGADTLFQLGALAAAEGQKVAACDIMRRYLHETAGEGDSPSQKEAQRIVEQNNEPAGEVSVLGARGSFLLADDKLVAVLPLSLPLLLPLGQHTLTVQLGQARVEEQVQVLSGQVTEMRVNQSTGIVVVSQPPAIVVLPEPGSSAPASALVEQALRRAAAREHQAIVTRDQALAQAPTLAGCLDTLACQLDLLAKNAAASALRVRMSGGAGSGPWQIELQLVDGGVGALAATATPSCADCTAEQAAAVVGAAFEPLLQQAAARPRGAIDVHSEPDGADVVLDGEKIGVTPLRASRFAGEYRLVLKKAGHRPYEVPLRVASGGTAQISAVLAPEPEVVAPPAAASPKPPVFRLVQPARPPWRIALGALVGGGGAVTVGFGISALSVDGQCQMQSPPRVCDAFYHSLVPGVLLVGAGALVLAGGITLIAIAVPPARKKIRVAATRSSPPWSW